MRAEKDQTCSQTIRKRRYSTEIKEGYIRLFWRIVLIVAVGWLLFTQVFLMGQAPDNEMFPAVEAGDLLIGYRLEQNLEKEDVVVYEAGGKTHVGRILGCETDVITMDDTGTLLVNGTAQTGEIAFPTYAKEGITWLDEDTGIKIQVTYIKECRTEFSASDEDVISEPSVEFYIVIWKKSVYISAAYVLLVKVEHCDFRIIFEDHTGNDFIANLYRFSCSIYFNILTHSHDFTCTFMSKCYRDQAKWISFKFMCICTTHTASFNFNQDIVISNRRNRIFFQFEMFLFS